MGESNAASALPQMPLHTSPLPCWSTPPQPQPVPGLPGTYRLADGTTISTTHRQIVQTVFPSFSKFQPLPPLRSALARFLRSIAEPGHEHRPTHSRAHDSAIADRARHLCSPALWDPYQILASPFTVHTRCPLAASSVETLLRIRNTGEHAIVMMEHAPRSLARKEAPAFLALMGAAVAAASDTFTMPIDHVLILWAAPDAAAFELISPDRALEAWVACHDLYRWLSRCLPDVYPKR